MTEVAVSSNAAIVTPCWSPDGKKLAFTTVVQPANGANVAAGQQDIWMIDADGDEQAPPDRRQRHQPDAGVGR